MKANKVFIAILTLLFSSGITAQEKKKLLKITYFAYPMSTHDVPPPDSKAFATHSDMLALAQSYKYKYSLYINTETSQSIYKLDTLIREHIPVGKEKDTYMVNNNIDYVVVEKKNSYFKHEKIFQREFFSQGKNKEIEWEITDETKTISGLKCRKAVSKKKEFKITVWFTEDIPVSSGPANFFNLPGLVVWSEDFFWTTEIEKTEYLENFDFNLEINKYRKQFEENKKGKYIDESLLLVKKSELVQSILDQLKMID